MKFVWEIGFGTKFIKVHKQEFLQVRTRSVTAFSSDA